MAVYMFAGGERRRALQCAFTLQGWFERVEGPESIGAQVPVEYDSLSADEKLALKRATGQAP